jgi:hypothetical protein
MESTDDFRALLIWHRRSGKDDVALNVTATKAMQRPGNYWHMLPEYAQARKAIWDAVNPHTGIRRIDQAFPPAIRASTLNDEMKIVLRNGSTWQVVGSDHYDALVGSSTAGIVFSEWAIAKPAAWAYLRPILLENGGWALFITTARGKNHAYTMLEGARSDPNWYTEVLPATQSGVFTPEQLAREEAEYLREHGEVVGRAMFEQEYLCSFEAAIKGAYYIEELKQARTEGRIVERIPVERNAVDLTFDLGIGDDTAIWLTQTVGREVHFVGCYANHGVGLDHYARWLEEWRVARHVPVWGEIILPHDAAARELGTGRSRQEVVKSLFGKTPRVLPRMSVEDGINAVRKEFPRFWFDESACGQGIEAVSQYRREWNERLSAFYDRPLHDWTSHYSDALRYRALSLRNQSRTRTGGPIHPKLAIV